VNERYQDSHTGGTISLLGGWGHGNLGDDLILYAYLSHLLVKGVSVEVVSHNATETQRRLAGSHLNRVAVVSRPTAGNNVLLCGGGYLNGKWHREGRRKGRGLVRAMDAAPKAAMHAVEFRNYKDHGWRAERLARRLLEGAEQILVRDPSSQDEIARFGVDAEVVPDAITLGAFHQPRGSDIHGSADEDILINLLPIASRPDRFEASFDSSDWDNEWRSFIRRRPQISLLAFGPDDEQYARTICPDRVVRVDTVDQAISSLSSARLVIGTRMHVALTAAMLGRPFLSIPYNGKVEPTLQVLGCSEACVEPREVWGQGTDEPSGVQLSTSHLQELRTQSAAALRRSLEVLR